MLFYYYEYVKEIVIHPEVNMTSALSFSLSCVCVCVLMSQFYLSLMNQQLPIESQLVAKLPDMLNAEVNY